MQSAGHAKDMSGLGCTRVGRCDRNPFVKQTPASPETAYLELTFACNNDCPGCTNIGFTVNVARRAPTQRPLFHPCPLSGQGWHQILDKLEPSVTHINLTGGEPTLRPDFNAIAISIDRRKIDFGILTNGRWREPEQLVSFLAELPHFRGFLVSLHGASPEAHEALSGTPGSFAETISNIALAVRAGLAVATSTVIARQNIPELDVILALSRDLGAWEASFNHFLSPAAWEQHATRGNRPEATIPTPNELRMAVRIIERLREETDDPHPISYGPCIPQCFEPSSSRGCSAGETSFVIDPWGNVKPCTDAILHCGNLLTQTVEEIWWGAEMQYWRGLMPAGCSNCAALAKCHAGCRATILASGLGHDPLMQGPVPPPTHSSDGSQRYLQPVY